MSEFAEQSSQELCVNFEFVQALGLCLQENCNDEETKGAYPQNLSEGCTDCRVAVVQVAAVKQCDVNPGDYRPVLRAASLIIFGFALLSYCMRLLSKSLHRSNWGADDTLMSLAAVSYSYLSTRIAFTNWDKFLIVPLLILFLLSELEFILSGRQSTNMTLSDITWRWSRFADTQSRASCLYFQGMSFDIPALPRLLISVDVLRSTSNILYYTRFRQSIRIGILSQNLPRPKISTRRLDHAIYKCHHCDFICYLDTPPEETHIVELDGR